MLNSDGHSADVVFDDPQEEVDGRDDLDGNDDVAASDAACTAVSAHGIPSSLDMAELATLVARVVRQDEAALASLYDSLCGRVYAVALQVTGQIAAAEEVMQDTFWQVWRQAPRFDASRGNVIAWVLTMARSRALDARRASSRNVLDGLRQVVDEHVEHEDAQANDPLDLLLTVQRDSELHTVLATLDPLKRQLISLVFYRGMTHDEVATHTGLPLGTVKSHLRRTFNALRTALGPDFNAGQPEVQP
jgi:RNA polymerase sigma factor (sigma-70 family)